MKEILCDIIPVDIVFDGVVSDNVYNIFDLMSYEHYRTKTVTMTQEERHNNLCSLQDIFTTQCKSKIRILPKKRILISTTSIIGCVKNEANSMGWANVVFKKADAGYLPNNTTNWVMF